MVKKARKRFSHEQYRRWGVLGGSPILRSYAEHRPVKGYVVKRVARSRK